MNLIVEEEIIVGENVRLSIKEKSNIMAGVSDILGTISENIYTYTYAALDEDSTMQQLIKES